MARSSAARSYPIRAVAQLTGLSVDTLRAWERRYAVVMPGRDGRGRVYSDADVDRLKQVAALVGRGHAIGTVARLPAVKLARLLEGPHAAYDGGATAVAVDLAPLIVALSRYDLVSIEALLARHAAVLPTPEFVFAVVLPVLRELGRRWESGALSPAQEHLVSAVIRSVLGGLLRVIGRADRSPKLLFTTLAGERHELGLLCAAVLAASAGCGVLYLGPDLAVADIRHALKATGAATVVVAATTPHAEARAEARECRKSLRGVELWIGGPDRASLLEQCPTAREIESLEAFSQMLARAMSAAAPSAALR